MLWLLGREWTKPVRAAVLALGVTCVMGAGPARADPCCCPSLDGNACIDDIAPEECAFSGCNPLEPGETCATGCEPFGGSCCLSFGGCVFVSQDHCGEIGGSGYVDGVECPPSGECTAPPLCSTNEDCSDGNACNGLESCVDGSCVPGTPTVCDPPPDPVCGGGLVCAPTTGACVTNPPAAPAGTACDDDGNGCTLDECDGVGNCVNYDDVSCDPPPDPVCGGGTVCDPPTGNCVTNPLAAPPGTACEADGNLCTFDACDDAGACLRASDVACAAPDDCDGGEACNPATGQCEELPDQPPGTDCDNDENLCTIGSCDAAGNCINYDELGCDPAPHPTCGGGFVCDPASGNCVANPPAAPSGTACEADGDLCTIDECDDFGFCRPASEVPCAEPDDCDGGEACNPATGQCEELPDQPPGTDCDNDDNLCTIGSCDDAGSCVNYEELGCDPEPHPICGGGLICDPSTADCVVNPPAATPGTACEADGSLCTIDECSEQGDCVQVDVVTCDPEPDEFCGGGNICDPTELCVPNPFAASPGTPCEADDDRCTIDKCDGLGACTRASEVSCQPANPPCEAGQECNPGTGSCEDLTDAPYLTQCDLDGEACTDDRCNGGGECVFYFELPDCTASCTDGTCDLGEDCISCAADCGPCSQTCGDGDCQPEETCRNCPLDCGRCEPFCGDSFCAPNEDCAGCAQDCGTCLPSCGNDICNPFEDCRNCPIDCCYGSRYPMAEGSGWMMGPSRA